MSEKTCINCKNYHPLQMLCGWRNEEAKPFDTCCDDFQEFTYLNPETDMSEADPILNDGDITAYATGAKRDKLDEPAWHLLPYQAINAIAKVLTAGAEKYGPRNWEQGLPMKSYLNHAMIHIGKFILSETAGEDWFAGDELEQEDHLAHAACNLLMALETRYRVRHGILPEELLKL